MSGAADVRRRVLAVLRNPEESVSAIPSLVGLLDHDDRSVRVCAAWGLCLIATANPTSVDRIRDRVRSEANSAEAVVVQQWLRTGAPTVPGSSSPTPSGADEGSADDASATDDASTAAGGTTASSEVGDAAPDVPPDDGVVEDDRFTVSLADTDLDHLDIVDRVDAVASRRTYVGLATIDGRERAVWLRTYRTPDGVVEESFREAISEAFERWSSIADYEHVLDIHDWGRRPRPWAVLDYAAAPMTTADRQGVDAALRATLGAVHGVAHAHDHGVTHGAIDPRSIAFVPIDGERLAAVEEFGIGTAFRSAGGPFPVDGRFAAPEHVDDDFGSIDRRTDVFHLGGILYALLTGEAPRDTPIDGNPDADPPVPSSVVADLPDAVDSIVGTAMALRKVERYESADALAAALRRVIDDR